jgi:hypothetical protein
LHLDLIGWAFTLKVKPFDEIEIDIEEGRGALRRGVRRLVKKA